MIMDSLGCVPTEEVLVGMVASLPSQMARHLKDVFGPRAAALMGLRGTLAQYFLELDYVPVRGTTVGCFGDARVKISDD